MGRNLIFGVLTIFFILVVVIIVSVVFDEDLHILFFASLKEIQHAGQEAGVRQ